MDYEIQRGKTLALKENYKSENSNELESKIFTSINNNKLVKNKNKNNPSSNIKIAANINHYSYKLNAKNM